MRNSITWAHRIVHCSAAGLVLTSLCLTNLSGLWSSKSTVHYTRSKIWSRQLNFSFFIGVLKKFWQSCPSFPSICMSSEVEIPRSQVISYFLKCLNSRVKTCMKTGCLKSWKKALKFGRKNMDFGSFTHALASCTKRNNSVKLIRSVWYLMSKKTSNVCLILQELYCAFTVQGFFKMGISVKSYRCYPLSKIRFIWLTNIKNA